MLTVKSKRYLGAGVTLGLIFLCELLGLPGLNLTPAQEITACILLIAAFLWVFEVVPLFVVSFLILALELVWLMPAVLKDTPDFNDVVFYSPFFSNIILLFIGGFVLSRLMQKYGLDLRFANAILRHTGGKPAATLMGVILSCAFLSMWISNTATAAMMLAIVLPLLKTIPEDNPFRVGLVLSIPFACNIGGIGTPIGTPPNAIALFYLSEHGIHLTFSEWILLVAPFLVGFLVFMWALLLKLYPAGETLVVNLDTNNMCLEETATGPFKPPHWLALGVFLLTALGWLLGGNIGLQTGTVALLPIIACFWLGLLDTNDFRQLHWDILYIVSGGLALGVALNVSGLGAVLVQGLPLDQGPMLIIVLMATVAAVLSTIMSNTATAGLMIPLAMSLPLGQVEIVTIVLALALMCSMAMALPVTTPPNAIAYSARIIQTKDMMITGGIITLVGLVSVIVVGPMYWRWLEALMQ